MNKKPLFLIFIGTFLAMIPEYLIRFKESVYMYMYNNFTTYPGDLWNFFANYLGKGLHYPPEYPAGLRFFYEIMGFYKYKDYTLFFTVNTLILLAFALGTSYLLYLIIEKRNGIYKFDLSKIWYFWILAPSFIFYGTINYDLPSIFLIVLAVYLFICEKYYGAIIALAIGMVAKVFPIFLLPIFIWRAPKEYRIKLATVFFVVVFALNLPYMIMNFETWIYPYIWQISSNLTTNPSQGTYWWLIYPLTGKLTGWFSLLLFGGLYLFTCFKLKKADFIDVCLAIIILFLLTDRIYSPQYNLYLLPFLVLATYPINKKIFYVIEIPNMLIVLFCFFLKENVVYLQILVFIRYFALVALYYNNLKASNRIIKSQPLAGENVS